jgi:IS30 family transposase
VTAGDLEAPPCGPSRYLQEHDRIHIADRLREKASIRQIAAELGRSPSTISREIRRNRRTMPKGGWYYRPHTAQARGVADLKKADRHGRPYPCARPLGEAVVRSPAGADGVPAC